MLTYMYYNEVSFGFDASKYNLTGLKAKCMNCIKLTIIDESAGHTLTLVFKLSLFLI